MTKKKDYQPAVLVDLLKDLKRGDDVNSKIARFIKEKNKYALSQSVSGAMLANWALSTVAMGTFTTGTDIFEFNNLRGRM